MSIITIEVRKARAANWTAIAFAKRGLRQAASKWYRAAHDELRMARVLKSIA